MAQSKNTTFLEQILIIRRKSKQFLSDFFSYFISKTFIRQLILALIFSVLLIGGTLIMLNLYTRHDRQFTVPDFTGLTIAEVEALAKEKKLRIEIVDSIYGAVGRRGTVVDQNPSSKFKVKENRTIFLTIKAYTHEMTKMPNIIGIALIQAKADLQTYGLQAGKLIYISSEYKNLVLQQQYNGQNIAQHTPIAKGTDIDLVLGKGKGNSTTIVPQLLGLSTRQAKSKALGESLNVEFVEFDNSVITYTDSIKAKVWQQEPAFKTDATLGATIKLWLTMNDSKVEIGKKTQQNKDNSLTDTLQ